MALETIDAAELALRGLSSTLIDFALRSDMKVREIVNGFNDNVVQVGLPNGLIFSLTEGEKIPTICIWHCASPNLLLTSTVIKIPAAPWESEECRICADVVTLFHFMDLAIQFGSVE